MGLPCIQLPLLQSIANSRKFMALQSSIFSTVSLVFLEGRIVAFAGAIRPIRSNAADKVRENIELARNEGALFGCVEVDGAYF